MTVQQIRDNFAQSLAENAYLNMCTAEEMKIVIEALEKQINHSNRWISVEDRLPEKSGEYLVYTEMKDIFNAEFDGCFGENGEFGCWKSYYDSHTLGFLDAEWTPYDGITHWMPLPESPEGENTNERT
jgi:hypothetical protein